MAHTTKIVEVLQTHDGIVSICISCCGLHGEWKPCPGCGDKEEKGCEHCHKTALEPHPHGGQVPVVRPGMVKEPDTRSWNTFHLVAQEESGPRLRHHGELQDFIDANHKRIAAQHQAAQEAMIHVENLLGDKVEHK